MFSDVYLKLEMAPEFAHEIMRKTARALGLLTIINIEEVKKYKVFGLIYNYDNNSVTLQTNSYVPNRRINPYLEADSVFTFNLDSWYIFQDQWIVRVGDSNEFILLPLYPSKSNKSRTLPSFQELQSILN